MDVGEAEKFFSELHTYSLMLQNWNVLLFMHQNLLPEVPNISLFCVCVCVTSSKIWFIT